MQPPALPPGAVAPMTLTATREEDSSRLPRRARRPAGWALEPAVDQSSDWKQCPSAARRSLPLPLRAPMPTRHRPRAWPQAGAPLPAPRIALDWVEQLVAPARWHAAAAAAAVSARCA